VENINLGRCYSVSSWLKFTRMNALAFNFTGSNNIETGCNRGLKLRIGTDNNDIGSPCAPRSRTAKLYRMQVHITQGVRGASNGADARATNTVEQCDTLGRWIVAECHDRGTYV
jgi:hypothetical protein